MYTEGVPPIFKENSPESCEVMCQCCIKLKLDLQEAILELKSTREIIKILQDELDTTRTMEHTCPDTRSMHNEKETILSTSYSNNWIQVPVNQYKKLQNVEENVTNLFPIAVNRYEILSNLKETTDSNMLEMDKKLRYNVGKSYPHGVPTGSISTQTYIVCPLKAQRRSVKTMKLFLVNAQNIHCIQFHSL
jgi:hypothetical protein